MQGNKGRGIHVLSGDLTQPRKERPMSTSVMDALTAADRCDRCGAQAYLRVTMPSGGELLFCAHHARAHQDKLQQVALKIQDETNRVN